MKTPDNRPRLSDRPPRRASLLTAAGRRFFARSDIVAGTRRTNG